MKISRLAPTPSGWLHLGNILNFALVHVLIRKSGGKILLRIDDMDVRRYRDAYLTGIFETLKWLGFTWDHGPADEVDFKRNYSQQNRLPLYSLYLEKLRLKNMLFACNCSRSSVRRLNDSGKYNGACLNKNLSFQDENVCWRLITDGQSRVNIHDLLMGDLNWNVHDTHPYPIVRGKDGMPSYQITSLCDDMYYGVNLVVRGQDLLESTAIQLWLAHLLELKSFPDSVFFHHPLILDNDGLKMSKSEGADSLYKIYQAGGTVARVFKELSGKLGMKESFKDLNELAAFWESKPYTEWFPSSAIG